MKHSLEWNPFCREIMECSNALGDKIQFLSHDHTRCEDFGLRREVVNVLRPTNRRVRLDAALRRMITE